MTLQELKALYEAKEQIGKTKAELSAWNTSRNRNLLNKLGAYPMEMNLYMKIPEQALEMNVPDSNLTPAIYDEEGVVISYTKLKDACHTHLIDGQWYAQMCVYDFKGGRTLPVESDEMYQWIDNFGIDNVVKELPIDENNII